MMSNYTKMLLTTRLTGVTFHGRQALLAELRTQADEVNRKLRHHNNYQGYGGIAIFQGSKDLGWIPKDIAEGLLLPEITASTIQIDNIELADIVGGTAEKEHYGAEIVMFLSGDAHTLEILAESINELKRKATNAIVAGDNMKHAEELKETEAKRVKQTKVDDSHKLAIFGSTHLKNNDIRKLLLEYDISDNQYKFDNDYYTLKHSSSISTQFKYLFFGPTPHSGKDMGEETSIIAHFEKDPNFNVKTIRNETGQLKITAKGLRSALEELVIA